MDSQPPQISVIIPCYNSGLYLPEAVASVVNSTTTNYEIVIIDDGSVDSHTQGVLNELETRGHKVIRQKNAGPAAARNAGVRHAQGEYLLFLDSDNKIRKGYIEAAIAILSKQPEVGVVYADASFFGASTAPRFTVEKFDMDRMLVGNYIDMCSVIRKKVWEDVGGFDEERILFGYEDWDLWIRVGLTSWKFEFIEDVLFDYRVRDNSLSTEIVDERKTRVFNYISTKHADLYYRRYKYYYRLFVRFHKNPFLYFAKVFYSKYILRKKYLP